MIYIFKNQIRVKYTFLIKLLNFYDKRIIIIHISQQTSVAMISFITCTKNITQISYAVLFEEQKSATRKSLGKDNSLSRFVERPRCSISGTFSEETRRRENASPKKSIILLVSLPRARARARTCTNRRGRSF